MHWHNGLIVIGVFVTIAAFFQAVENGLPYQKREDIKPRLAWALYAGSALLWFATAVTA